MTKGNILIVEDEGVLAKGIERKMVTLGYTVTGMAFSGEEALRLVDEQRPDLVLMDIKLAGPMDGVEAARQIREKFHLPVVYLTAYSDKETLRRAKITEPYGYILKPVVERELHCNIEMALYRHRTEAELSRKKEMEAFGVFSIGISHDFNNLIQIIDGLVESAAGRCNRISESNCLPLLEKAGINLRKAADLVKLYQDIFKGDPLNKGTIILSDLIAKAGAHVPALNEPGISCRLEVNQTLSPLRGDAARLEEVFTHLLRNAVEALAGKKNGEITVSAADVRVDIDNDWLLKPGSYVKISVRDQGKGIPAENLKKLFIPYFSTKDEFTRKGLGLGLTLCYSIIKRHEGHIEIKSEEGKGTEVNVFLPAPGLQFGTGQAFV
jgi:signal transduction histidine kinase